MTMTTGLQSELSSGEFVRILALDEPHLRRCGIISLAIFGSRARGDHRPDSDLDILIDYDRSSAFSLLTLAHVQNRIEDRTGCPVQVSTRSSFDPDSLVRIDTHAIRVF